MINPMDLTASQILAIKTSNPEKLFSIDSFELSFMRLWKKWHLDTNKSTDAQKVFIHIMSIADTAKTKISSDLNTSQYWEILSNKHH